MNLLLKKSKVKAEEMHLSNKIKDAVNNKLELLEGFGGVEGVFFTSFVLQ